MTDTVPRVLDGVGDVQAAVGTHVGYSSWHQITQERIDAFADATGDHQWIHVDPVRASEGPFGTTIAHGYLTLSLMPMLLAEILTIEGVAMSINYGADRVRFPTPVPAGGHVRAGAEVVALTETAAGHRLVVRVIVELRGVDRPACVVDAVSVLVAGAGRRPEETGAVR